MSTDVKHFFTTHWRAKSGALASDLKNEPKMMLRPEVALTKNIISLNPPGLTSILHIDLDHEDSRDRLSASPVPFNITVDKASNGHGQGFIFLEHPVNLGKAKQSRYLSAVRQGLNTAIGGDTAHAGRFGWNPCKQELWTPQLQHTELFDLSTIEKLLGDFLPEQTAQTSATPSVRQVREQWGDKTARAIMPGERNQFLFDQVRVVAYGLASRPAHEFDQRVYELAYEINASFPYPLEITEVESTVESISRFCAERFGGIGHKESSYCRCSGCQSERRTKFDDALVDELVSLKASGLSWRDVGAHYDLTADAARKLVKRKKSRAVL